MDYADIRAREKCRWLNRWEMACDRAWAIVEADPLNPQRWERFERNHLRLMWLMHRRNAKVVAPPPQDSAST